MKNNQLAVALVPLIPDDLQIVLTGAQIRMARVGLRLSQTQLAQAAHVSVPTIQRVERANGVPRVHAATLDAIRTTLERLGVVFLDPIDRLGPGVRVPQEEGE